MVSVKGLAEREVMADRAISPFAYKLAGNDLMQLYAQVKQKNNTVVAFLKAAGIGDDEITVAAPDVYDASTQQYASNDLRYNYIVTSVVTVCTDKVQAIINGKGKKAAKLAQKQINPDLYLRKFLVCPVCGHPLTGATSTGGRRGHPYFLLSIC